MSIEMELVRRMKDYFGDQGWDVKRQVKIRGRIVDIVAVRDNEIALVEVNGPMGDYRAGNRAITASKGGGKLFLSCNSQKFTCKVCKGNMQKILVCFY